MRNIDYLHKSGEQAPHWQGGPIDKICQYCGKVYKVGKSRINKSHYCSNSCTSKANNSGNKSYLWKGGELQKNCLQCGKEFHCRQVNKNRAKFCSNHCHNVWRSKNKSGSNSHAWQGGKSFEPYPETFNKTFKRMIRERDNYICKICGKRGTFVHHINYVKSDTFPDNCITLCCSCHTKTNSNRKYWQLYFSNILS